MSGTTPAWLADQIAKHIAKIATYTPPATVYAALMVTDSSDAAAGTECSDATYARIPCSLGASGAGVDLFTDLAGVLTTCIDVLWGAATAQYVVHAVEFYDSLLSSGSNNRVLPFIPISPNVTVPINEQFKLPSGSGTETVS